MKKILIIFLCIFLFSCKTSFKGFDGVHVSLKYPVILVHGIAFHDRFNYLTFWGRIPLMLDEIGVKYYYGNTDAWGAFETNAEILKRTVDKVLSETKSEKVNIIAHSKGGIDSRYFIWKYNYGDKVASLTTISTPHRGAEIADLIWDQSFIHDEITKDSLMVVGSFLGDMNPDFYKSLHLLTTANMTRFNEEVILDPNVYFQSLYTTMNNPTNDPLFAASYRYIKRVRGNNDGLVSEYSARWGSRVIKLSGRLSHIDIVDLKMISFWGISVPDIYIRILRDLSARGF